MKKAIIIILAASFCVSATANRHRPPTIRNHATRTTIAPAKLPYLGKWSNGRGERLSVTERTLKFNSDRAVTYRDVTKVTDGNHFSLEITSRGKLNYFTKFLALEINGNEMKMTLYNSYQEMFDGKNPQGESTWDRDK